MTAPYSGGFEITTLKSDGLVVYLQFTSTYDDLYQYQVYVNRVLSGVTEHTIDRSLYFEVTPTEWPQEIQLLAVDPAERLTDYGADLPPRPYNQVKLTIDASAWTDAVRLEVTSGTTPGGSVDDTNIIGRVLFDEARSYDFITDPLQGSGTWNFKAYGVDGTLPVGNQGTPTSASVTIVSRPPDVTPLDDGTRFASSASGGTLTVSFNEY